MRNAFTSQWDQTGYNPVDEAFVLNLFSSFFLQEKDKKFMTTLDGLKIRDIEKGFMQRGHAICLFHPDKNHNVYKVDVSYGPATGSADSNWPWNLSMARRITSTWSWAARPRRTSTRGRRRSCAPASTRRRRTARPIPTARSAATTTSIPSSNARSTTRWSVEQRHFLFFVTGFLSLDFLTVSLVSGGNDPQLGRLVHGHCDEDDTRPGAQDDHVPDDQQHQRWSALLFQIATRSSRGRT